MDSYISSDNTLSCFLGCGCSSLEFGCRHVTMLLENEDTSKRLPKCLINLSLDLKGQDVLCFGINDFFDSDPTPPIQFETTETMVSILQPQ